MSIFLSSLLLTTACLLACEWRLVKSDTFTSNSLNSKLLQRLSAIAKMLATSIILLYFVSSSSAISELSFHFGIMLGLCFCWCGDLLLLGKSKTSFKAGIAAFACGHLSYAWSFYSFINTQWVWPVALMVLLCSLVVGRWLWPFLRSSFRGLVPFYLVVISLMVIMGLGASISYQNYWLAAGVLLFAFSDIFVARNRFVSHGFINRLIGLPLYYLGQSGIVIGTLLII